MSAMRSKTLTAQEISPQRFLGFFMPNGTEPNTWNPDPTDAITEADLGPMLVDLTGFDGRCDAIFFTPCLG